MAKVRIIPAILADSLAEFKEKISKLERIVSLAQIDIMDGFFVPEKSFSNIEEIRNISTSVKYELHLMVKDPFDFVKPWLDFEKVEKIIFHIESVKNPNEIIKLIKSSGKKIGIAFNPETSVEKVRSYFTKIDTIMAMGVRPGKSGQKFNHKIVNKIKQARRLSDKINIEIDGGVNSETAPLMVEAGANILAAGSFIFNSDNLSVAIDKLKKITNEKISNF